MGKPVAFESRPLETLNALAIALRLHQKVVRSAYRAAFMDGRRILAKKLEEVDTDLYEQIGKLEHAIGELTPKKPKRIPLKDLSLDTLNKNGGSVFVVMPKGKKK